MKKGIIVLLIAVLVSGFAFAKLTGDAGVRYEAFLGDSLVFLNTNEKSLDFTFTFTSDDVAVDGEEGSLHVEVAASAKFILGDKQAPNNGIYIDTDAASTRAIGAVISLDTAKIVGKNWYVSVLGTQGAYDYAKADVLKVKSKDKKDDFGNAYDRDKQAASYVVGYNKVPGVTVGIAGFTASVGFDFVQYKGDGLFIGSASVETPEFAFNDDAVKVQAAAEFSRFALKDKGAKAEENAIGASAKATVAIQDITVDAAVDLGLDNVGVEIDGEDVKETQFSMDARVGFKYNFVTASIYTFAGKAPLSYGDGSYLGLDPDEVVFDAYKDFYLEAKAAFDLNAFELPLTVTVSAKNITNSEAYLWKYHDFKKAGIVPAIEVKYAKDAITAAASFDINTEFKDWSALVYGTYAFEKFTAGAGVKVAGTTELSQISFGAFAESDKIVNGATFGLSYGLTGDDVYGDGGAAALSGAKFSSNYKADVDPAGTVLAYCKITF